MIVSSDADSTAINVLPIGAVKSQKEVYHIQKNADGSYSVHSQSTNETFNVATVCPKKVNETAIKTCVALIFNADKT